VCKVCPRRFKKFGLSVNKAAIDRRRNVSNLEFWAIFWGTLNICGELVRKIGHLMVLGAGCKINY